MTVLFLPISMLLGLLGALLSWITGQTPFKLRLAMARGELDQLIKAGHEAGILAAGQTSLAQNIFEVGNQAAVSFGVPGAPGDGRRTGRSYCGRPQARRRNIPFCWFVRPAGSSAICHMLICAFMTHTLK